jgi:hypothetical protein
MALFTAALTAAVVFEIIDLKGKGQKKEIAVLLIMAVLTLAFGLFYMYDSKGDSFSVLILKALGRI